LDPHGRFRILGKKMSDELSQSNCSTFPPFCYYSHDIEDEIEITEFQMIGGGDFMKYDCLLLWLLTPFLSLKIQLFILFGFILCIQIGIYLTIWIASRLKETNIPGTPIPVIVISIYAFVLSLITQNLGVDCL
jgi:hypothetical protein